MEKPTNLRFTSTPNSLQSYTPSKFTLKIFRPLGYHFGERERERAYVTQKKSAVRNCATLHHWTFHHDSTCTFTTQKNFYFFFFSVIPLEDSPSLLLLLMVSQSVGRRWNSKELQPPRGRTLLGGCRRQELWVFVFVFVFRFLFLRYHDAYPVGRVLDWVICVCGYEYADFVLFWWPNSVQELRASPPLGRKASSRNAL